VVAPVGLLGYALFLSFEKRLVDENPDHVFVPRSAIIESLTGEVRPFDSYISQSHEVKYVNENSRTKAELGIDCHLICTAYNGTPLRPGVGTTGFMANCTCQDPYFKFYEMKLGYNENHLIAGASFMYKYHFLQADKNITGREIQVMHSKLSHQGSEITTQRLFFDHRDWYFFPVEFQYNKKVTGDSQLSDLASQRVLIKNCVCMTHCMWKKPQHRSHLSMGYKSMKQRVSNRVPPMRINELNDYYKDVEHEPNTSGYVKYVNSVTWLRQFQDIPKEDLIAHLMPLKNVPRRSWPQPPPEPETDSDDLDHLFAEIATYEREVIERRMDADFSNSSPDQSPEKSMHKRHRGGP
jgi:hypothetical protein